MIVPVIFVVVLQIQSGSPNDVPLGRYIRDSGIVTPLVVLLFMSIWGFPLITALVAAGTLAAGEPRRTPEKVLHPLAVVWEWLVGKARPACAAALAALRVH